MRLLTSECKATCFASKKESKGSVFDHLKAFPRSSYEFPISHRILILDVKFVTFCLTNEKCYKMLDFFVVFPTASKLENVEKTCFLSQEHSVYQSTKRGEHLKKLFGKFDRSFGMHGSKPEYTSKRVNFEAINISLECEAKK